MNGRSVMINFSHKKYRLLRIDMSDPLSKMLSNELEEYGCEISIASSIEQSMRTAIALQPEFILLDIKLGSENGLELIPRLRSLLPVARIVVLTSYGSIKAATWAIKAGADEFVAKPCDASLVFDILTNAPSDKAVSDIVSSPDDLRSRYVISTYFQHQFNVSRTARALGIQRRSLQRILAMRKKRCRAFDRVTADTTLQDIVQGS